MRKALYGANGDRIDLAAFVKREGSVEHSNWVVLPFCPGCGAAVSPVNAKMTQGFYETRTELLSTFREQGRTTQTPHFRHKKKNPLCPYDDEPDPFFDMFGKSYFNYRDEKRVREVLFAAKDFNGRIVGALYNHLTGKTEISYDEKKQLWLGTEKLMCRMTVLVHEPWIFPFAQILFAGSRQRTFKSSGKTHTLIFRPIGEQAIYFSNPKQGKIRAIIPESIGLFYDNTDKKKNSYAPFRYKKDGPQVAFKLSRNEANRLAS